MIDTRPVLECQDCGIVIKELTPEEVRLVAANPQNFIIWCGPCGAALLRELRALDGAR